MANTKFDVQTYHYDNVIPMVDAQINVWPNMDDISYRFADGVTEGASTTFMVPFLTKLKREYGIGNGDADGYNERRGSLSVDIPYSNPVIIQPAEYKLYNIESKKMQLAKSQSATICADIEKSCVEAASYGGFRYFGRSRTGNESFSIDDLRRAMTVARNFSPQTSTLFCYLPDATSTVVANTTYQQFTTMRNDETAQTNEIQGIEGVVNARFFQTQMPTIHYAGEAAKKVLTVQAVEKENFVYKGATYTGTKITVTGAASGDTVVENDVLSVDAKKYFLRDDRSASINILQGNVVTGGTATPTDLTFTVGVDLLSAPAPGDSPGSTDVVTAALAVGDKLVIEGDHVCGFVFIKEGMKRASIMLGDPDPFNAGQTKFYEKPGCQGFNVRCWGGMNPGNANVAMVQDGLYGVSAVAPYVMRLVLPISSLDLYA